MPTPSDAPKKPVDTSKLDWGKILQTGAEALAQSFGSALGGPLAKAFVGALLGEGKDDAFQKDVMASLSRIEAKLDQVISFLNEKLPAVIREQVDRSLVDQEQRELRAKSVSVEALIAMLDSPDHKPTELELAMLASAANSSIELGLRLSQKGQAWYPAAIHGFTTGFTAYARLIAHNPNFGKALARYSREYLRITSPWIEPQSAMRLSFADLSADLPGQYELARASVEPIANRTEEFALLWTVWEPSVIGELTLPRQFAVFGGWFSMNTSNWSLNGDDKSRVIEIPEGPIGDPTPLILKTGFKISPLWEPRNSWQNGMAEYESFVSKLYWAMDTYRNHPARIDAVAQGKESVLNLRSACLALDIDSMSMPTAGDA